MVKLYVPRMFRSKIQVKNFGIKSEIAIEQKKAELLSLIGKAQKELEKAQKTFKTAEENFREATEALEMQENVFNHRERELLRLKVLEARLVVRDTYELPDSYKTCIKQVVEEIVKASLNGKQYASWGEDQTFLADINLRPLLAESFEQYGIDIHVIHVYEPGKNNGPQLQLDITIPETLPTIEIDYRGESLSRGIASVLHTVQTEMDAAIENQQQKRAREEELRGRVEFYQKEALLGLSMTPIQLQAFLNYKSDTSKFDNCQTQAGQETDRVVSNKKIRA